MEALASADMETLIEIDEIGERIAQSVLDYFTDIENQELINRLKNAGLQFEIIEDENQSTKLNGAKIVISGSFTKHSRDELKSIIERNGGKNVSSVSKNTNYFLAGEKVGPKKLEKVQKLGIQIISEDEFISLIDN